MEAELISCRHCGARVRDLVRHLGSPHRRLCRAFYYGDLEDEAELPDCSAAFELEDVIDRKCYRGEIQGIVLQDLMRLRLAPLGDTEISRLKDAVCRWVKAALASVQNCLASHPFLQEVREKLMSVLTEKLDFFKGLLTQAQELSQIGKRVPVLKAVSRVVGEGVKGTEHCYSFKAVEWLQALLKQDRKFRQMVVASSELWKTGALHSMPDNISDITHGSVFRRSPLARQATPAEANDLRIGWMMSYDDVELCKPLGARKGVHNTAGVYATIANLPAEERFKHQYMMPWMLGLESIVARCGFVRALCGVNPQDGSFIHEDPHAPAQQLRSATLDDVMVQVTPFCVCHSRRHSCITTHLGCHVSTVV